MYDWGYGWMPHGGMYGAGWVLMVLFWILLIIGIVALIKWLLSSGHQRPSEPRDGRRTALDILKERYARGEIDHEEFEERRRRLND